MHSVSQERRSIGAARAGKLADRGLGQKTTGVALVILLLSWLPIGYVHTLWFLILGVILLDLAVQAVHVTNQSLIYEVRPEAQSRLTASLYDLLFHRQCNRLHRFYPVYAWAGWTAVCWLGAGVSAAALVFWMIDRYMHRNIDR